VSISNGNSVTLNINDADSSATNELQTLSSNGNTISLSNNGGSITLPPDQVNDADADSTNELQTLSISNDTLFLSNGGFVKLPNSTGGTSGSNVGKVLFVSQTFSSSRTSDGSTYDTIQKINLEANIQYELEMLLSASIQRYTCGATSSVRVLDKNNNPVLYESLEGNSLSVSNCNSAVANSNHYNLYFTPTISGSFSFIYQYDVSGYNNYQNQGGNGGSARILLRQIASGSNTTSPSTSQISSVSNKNWQMTTTDTTFLVPSDISALKVLLSGVSGGKGGTGTYINGVYSSPYPGGEGGEALRVELLLLNLNESDTIRVNRALAGANSTQNVSGSNCGTGCPVSFQAGTGDNGQSTKLFLNGELLVTITGGTGGTGGYKLAAWGSGSPGATGSPGTYSALPNVVILGTETIGINLQSSLVIYY
jgi:hypothetical protein